MTRWEFFERAPRILLRWVCTLAALYVLILSEWFGFTIEQGMAVVYLGFIGAVYGIRGYEKLKANEQ